MYVPRWSCASVSVPCHRRYKRRKTPGLGALPGNLFHLRELMQGHFLWLSLNFHHCALGSMVLEITCMVKLLWYWPPWRSPRSSIFQIGLCQISLLSSGYQLPWVVLSSLLSRRFHLDVADWIPKADGVRVDSLFNESSHMLSTLVSAIYKCFCQVSR